MSVGLEDQRLIEQAELVMAMRGYRKEERKRWDEGIDYVASHPKSEEKILLRIVTEPKSTSSTVGLDVVGEMSETMKREDYDKGVLIGKRFSKAAKKEMRREGIQMFSEKFTPRFEPRKLYLTMQEYIDGLCQMRCGFIPKQESDCQGRDSKGRYTCKIRLISDNASFHFERGWTDLLQRDFERLIAVHNSTSDNS